MGTWKIHLAAALILATGACAIDLDKAPCPCTEGWVCCPSTKTCVKPDDPCVASVKDQSVPDVASDAAPLDAAPPDATPPDLAPPPPTWIYQAGCTNKGMSLPKIADMAQDAFGNTIITGTFDGSACFGGKTFTAQGLGFDSYVAKVDYAGKLVWAVPIAGHNHDKVKAVATDAAGNVYVAGNFDDLINSPGTKFGPFTRRCTAVSKTGCIFVAKLSPQGTFLRVTTAVRAVLSDLAVDSTGECHITGILSDTLTLGSFTLKGKAVDHTAPMYVARLSAAGKWTQALSVGTISAYRSFLGRIALDSAGDRYLAGGFTSSTSLGSVSLSSAGGEDVFVARMDPAGKVQWAVSAGGTGDDAFRDLAVDSAGNTFFTGYIEAPATFGATKLSVTGKANAFVARVSPKGKVLWAVGSSGAGPEWPYRIALDAAGNPYVGGAFMGGARFGTLVTNVPDNNSDAFVVRMDASGKFLGLEAWGSKDPDHVSGMAVDAASNLYVAGVFKHQTTFDTTTLTPSGDADLYVWKNPKGLLCGAGLTRCGDACVNVGSDAKHCGGCDNACAGVCQDGVCCGDGKIMGLEQCDGTNLAGKTCTSEGMSGGTLACSKTCQLDMSACTWAVVTGNLKARGSLIAVDKQGNIFLAGGYSDGAMVGNHGLASKGHGDLYVARLDPTGKVGWVSSGGGKPNVLPTDIALDSKGDVYVAGLFGVWPGTNYAYNLTPPFTVTFGKATVSGKGNKCVDDKKNTWCGMYNMLVKLDGKTGAFLWAAMLGETREEYNGVGVDTKDNPLFGGAFIDTATLGSTTLTAPGKTCNGLLAKLTGGGKHQWAIATGGAADTHIRRVAADSADNVHFTGIYYGTATFGSTTLTTAKNACNRDIYVAKVNSSGAFLWATGVKMLNDASTGNVNRSTDLAVDSKGNPFVAGILGTKSRMAFGSTTIEVKEGNDMFVTKLDGAKGTFLWTSAATGKASYGHNVRLGLDGQDNAYVAGTFYFSPAVLGSITLNNLGGVGPGTGMDVYAAKINGSTGAFLWAAQGGGKDVDYGNDLAVDTTGNTYVVGEYESSPAAFGSATLTLPAGSYRLPYVWKLDKNGK